MQVVLWKPPDGVLKDVVKHAMSSTSNGMETVPRAPPGAMGTTHGALSDNIMETADMELTDAVLNNNNNDDGAVGGHPSPFQPDM